MSYLRYFEVIENLIQELKNTQQENIKKAAGIIAESIMSGEYCTPSAAAILIRRHWKWPAGQGLNSLQDRGGTLPGSI